MRTSFRKIALGLALSMAMPFARNASAQPANDNIFKVYLAQNTTMAPPGFVNVQDEAQKVVYALEALCLRGDTGQKREFTSTLSTHGSNADFLRELQTALKANATTNAIVSAYLKDNTGKKPDLLAIYAGVEAIQKSFGDIDKYYAAVNAHGQHLANATVTLHSDKKGILPYILLLAEPVVAGQKPSGVTELLEMFSGSAEMAKFFDPSRRFGELGTAYSAFIEVTPALWRLVKQKMEENATFKAELDADPNLRAVFDYIFANEKNYSDFLSAPDRRQFIINLLTNVITIGVPAPAQPTETPAEGEAPAPPTTAQTVTVTSPTAIQQNEAARVATRFLGVWGSARFSLDEIYDIVMRSGQLQKDEKMVFSQMFVTLYSCNKELGEAFLLTTYSALADIPPGKTFGNVFQEKFDVQLDLIGNTWGGSIRTYFESLREKGHTKLSSFERYLDVMYTNLALGSLLVNGFKDKPMRANFGRAFAIGFIGGVTGMIDDVFVKNLARMEDALQATMAGEHGQAVSWTAPVSALVALSAGLTRVSMEYAVLYPWAKMYQAVTEGVGSNISKQLRDAAKDDKSLRLKNPLILTAVLSVPAIYGCNLYGIRGITQPVTDPALVLSATQVQPPRGAGGPNARIPREWEQVVDHTKQERAEYARRVAEAKAAGEPIPEGLEPVPNVPPEGIFPLKGAQNVIDANLTDMFGAALEMADGDEYENVADIYAAALGLHTVAYAMRVHGLQEENSSFWRNVPIIGILFDYSEDIDTDIMEDFKKANDREELFKVIKQINDNSQTPLNEIMDKYDDDGIEGLKKLLKELEGDTKKRQMALKGIPTKLKHA